MIYRVCSPVKAGTEWQTSDTEEVRVPNWQPSKHSCTYTFPEVGANTTHHSWPVTSQTDPVPSLQWPPAGPRASTVTSAKWPLSSLIPLRHMCRGKQSVSFMHNTVDPTETRTREGINKENNVNQKHSERRQKNNSTKINTERQAGWN